MADFPINVIVRPEGAVQGTRRVRQELQRTQTTANGLGRALASAFAAIGIAQAVRAAVNLVDTYTNLQNRLRTVTDSQAELAAVTDGLFAVAERTRSSFENTAELYARVALASRELGISQQQTLQFTESLNEAVILSGASAQEASAGLIQLSQGLASGTLRGDELRSVLEQLPVVADVIAESMGVTRGELRLLGAEGKINAEIVLRAFEEAREELAERFGETVPTISQGFQAIRNAAVRLAGQFDQSTGASAGLSRSLVVLADNLNTVARGAGVAATTIGTALALEALPAAVRGVRLLTAALAANPLGAFLVAVTAGASTLIFFGDQFKLAADSATTFADLTQATLQELPRIISDTAAVINGTFGPALDRLGQSLGRAFDAVSQAVASVIDALDLRPVLDRQVARMRRFASRMLDALGPLGDALRRPFEGLELSLRGVLRVIARAIDTTAALLLATIESLAIAVENPLGALEVAFVNTFNAVLANGVNLVTNLLDLLAELPRGLGVDVPTIDIAPPKLEPFSAAGENAAKAFRQALEESLQDINLAETTLNELLALSEDLQKAVTPSESADLGGSRGQGKSSGKEGFAALLERLRQENDLLRLNEELRERRSVVLEFEDELERKLIDTERQAVEAEVARGQALQRYADILDEIRGPEQEMLQRQEDLQSLWLSGALNLGQYRQALRDLRQEFGTLGELENLLLRLADQTSRFADQIGSVFSRAFSQLADAFTDFLLTGEANFERFASSIVRELVKIIAVQTVAAIVQSFLNPGAAVAGTASATATASQLAGITGALSLTSAGVALPGFATGGEFMVGGSGGTDSQLVAFRATPNERVIVQTPAQQREANRDGPAPQVNVHVVNSVDPRDTIAAMGSRAGERVIVNAIRNNPAAIRAALRG